MSFVQRAFDGHSTALEDMSINHCGLYVFVAEEFLDGTDIVAGFKEVGGKTVPKGRLRTGGRYEG
jgi:hypothetical protein